MRRVPTLCWSGVVVALTIPTCPAGAQESLGKAKDERPQASAPGRPAFTPPLVSPEVQPDRRVTFRLRAPNAKDVSVSGEWGGGVKAMTRDDQGTWSVTVGPLDANLYGY